MERIIEVRHLKKTFGDHQAIEDISLHVNRGQMIAVLGPNGAGKSTMINILCTLLSKDRGDVIIDGYTLGKQNDEIRRKIGVVFQNGVLDDLLTVKENLYIRGDFYHLGKNELNSCIDRIAQLTEIDDLLDKQYCRMSGGQKRRCDIARALLHSPSILFLDEPSTGLDPEMRSMIWKTIKMIQKEKNTSIIMTTHYMEEAARADYVFVIKDGRLLTSGSPYELKEHFSKDHLRLYTSCDHIYHRNGNGQNGQNSSIESILKSRKLIYHRYRDTIEIELKHTTDAVGLLDILKGRYSDFEVVKGNLEDAYLSIIGSDQR